MANVYLNKNKEQRVQGGHPWVFRSDIEHVEGAHTPGGVVYYVPAIKTVFSGDTLFCESIGRTDFPGGDLKTLLNSIRKELFTLPDDTVIVAGHEGESSIGHEKKYNPFLIR